MSTFDKIVVVVVILQAAIALVQKLTRHRNQREVDQALAEQPAPTEDFEGWRTQVRARLADLTREAAQLVDALRGSAERLRPSGPTGRLLADAVQARLVPDAERTGQRLAELAGVLAEARPTMALPTLAAEVSALADRLQRQRKAAKTLEDEARWRSPPERVRVLADAEAVATAILAPLRSFATAHGRKSHWHLQPIAVLQSNTLWADLLPQHLAVAASGDLDDEPLQWAEVIYGVCLQILEDPDFSRDIEGLLPSAGPPRLPIVYNRQVHLDLHAATAHWLGTYVADALVILTLGPAGLRGLMHALQKPASVAPFTIAAASDGQHLAVVPPSSLRMGVASWFLERIGFAREAETLRNHWEMLHGPLDALSCPTATGDRIGLSAAPFRVRGQQALETFYTATWPSLGGYLLSSVPGLEMSPGLWAKVRQRARDLATGVAFQDDPRVVVAAAIEAAAAHPGTEGRIAEGVRRAVLSVGLDENRLPDVHYGRQRGASTRLTPADVRDALVLGALLGPRSRFGRR